MPQRKILVPSPVTLVDPLSKRPLVDENGVEVQSITFQDYCKRLLLAKVWEQGGYIGFRSAVSIERALDESGDVFMLATEDWAKLRDLVQNGEEGFSPYPGFVLRQLLSFMDAIIEAKEV